MIRSSRIRRLAPVFLALACALMLATGCSSTGGGSKGAAEPSGPSLLAAGRSVGNVSADLKEEVLEPNVVASLKQFTVAERLQSRVTLETKARSGGDLDVQIHVIGMRLRSTGNAIWWGPMAGADWINVEVVVAEDGRELKRFETGISTSLGGFGFGGREVRVDRMVNALAKRIADGI